MEKLLEVRNLNISIKQEADYIPVIKDVHFQIDKSKTVGLLGESGCGKSLTGSSLLRLLPHPVVRLDNAEIYLENQALHTISNKKFNSEVRWRKISIIFQESSAALNPVVRIGTQFDDILEKLGQTRGKAHSLLKECGFNDPELIMRFYPHQLSGGMKQRIMIAMALVGEPLLLICDEATTASDVTLQDQILDLLLSLQAKFGMSILFISHDLRLIKKMCHYTYVMYCGKIVESQSTRNLVYQPRHHYTKGLMQSQIGLHMAPKSVLSTIKGRVPQIDKWHTACSFAERCPSSIDICKSKPPDLIYENSARLACFSPLKYNK